VRCFDLSRTLLLDIEIQEKEGIAKKYMECDWSQAAASRLKMVILDDLAQVKPNKNAKPQHKIERLEKTDFRLF
jgi:hypothetical protein